MGGRLVVASPSERIVRVRPSRPPAAEVAPAAQVGDGQGLHRSVPRALQLAVLRVATDGNDDARAVAARKHCNDGVAPPISQARQRLGRRPALTEELRRPQQAGPTLATDGDELRTADARDAGVGAAGPQLWQHPPIALCEAETGFDFEAVLTYLRRAAGAGVDAVPRVLVPARGDISPACHDRLRVCAAAPTDTSQPRVARLRPRPRDRDGACRDQAPEALAHAPGVSEAVRRRQRQDRARDLVRQR